MNLSPKKVKVVRAWAIVSKGYLAKSHLTPDLAAYQIFDDYPQEFYSREARVIEIKILIPFGGKGRGKKVK